MKDLSRIDQGLANLVIELGVERIKKDHFYQANHVEEFCKTTLPIIEKIGKKKEKMR